MLLVLKKLGGQYKYSSFWQQRSCWEFSSKNLQKNDDFNVIGSSRKDTDLFNLEETKEIKKNSA